MSLVHDLIRQKVAERGLDLKALSLGMGRNHGYLHQYLTQGVPKKLNEDDRAYLARALGVPEAALKDNNPLINQQMSRSVPTFKRGIAKAELPVMLASPENLLKVLGMAEGGKDGWCPLNGDVVQYITRPDNLRGVPNAYAVFIKGESMAPRYEPGEIVHVHPGRPPQPGSYVLVQRHNPDDETQPLAVVKRLVRRSGSKVILAQLNPKKEFEVPAGEIVSMHKVVGSSEA